MTQEQTSQFLTTILRTLPKIQINKEYWEGPTTIIIDFKFKKEDYKLKYVNRPGLSNEIELAACHHGVKKIVQLSDPNVNQTIYRFLTYKPWAFPSTWSQS